MRKQVEAWQRSEVTDVTAKVLIYEAFVEGKLKVPKHLARTVHDLYFEPNTRTSDRERSGVCSTRLLRRSRNWTPSHSSRPRPSWGEFLEGYVYTNGKMLPPPRPARPRTSCVCASALGLRAFVRMWRAVFARSWSRMPSLLD